MYFMHSLKNGKQYYEKSFMVALIGRKRNIFLQKNDKSIQIPTSRTVFFVFQQYPQFS